MYHLELRQFPHNHCRFNMDEGELWRVLEPWVREQAVEVGERKWSPHTARITILEGPTLAIQQLSMGRGWGAAQREGVEVTERVLAKAKEAVEAGDAAAQRGSPATGASAMAAALGSDDASPGAASAVDQLALGVQLASLLGEDPSGLLAAWRAVAARSRGVAPSESLALAERELRDATANRG
jgi:hypothetical protein